MGEQLKQLQMPSFERYPVQAISELQDALPSTARLERLLPAMLELQQNSPITWAIYKQISPPELLSLGITALPVDERVHTLPGLIELVKGELGEEKWRELMVRNTHQTEMDVVVTLLELAEGRVASDASFFDWIEVGYGHYQSPLTR